ncbi:DUF1826 domain-containing protein [Gymnodinialimonas sp. 2305UL16-5]|uniref:DUF1826 domain-containing protein n=1 Tax=Gymnodinialimonas mytili TaxID=3126503 RepID=UPI0030AA06D6
MNLIRATVQNAAVGVAVADKPKNLKAFLRPGCAAAIWRRQLVQEFQSWVNALEPSCLPQGRVVVQPHKVHTVLASLCETSQTLPCPQRAQLIDDIADLADIFSDLMNAPYLRLRLQAVTSNACRKFHIDAVTARLVCTYRGTGTQYGVSPHGNEPARIFTVPTGAPILLRGTRWPEIPASGLLHRSPPIEGTGETRLVLVLDPVFDLEDAE